MRLLHKTTFPHKTALRFMLLVLGLFVMFLSNPTEVSAQSISGVAEPLNHTQPNPDFEDILAPEGGWISTTATAGQEGIQAFYALPQLNVCNKAKINSINIRLTASGNSTPYSFDLTGVGASVINRATSTAQIVQSVDSGSRMDGGFALALSPDARQEIVRGITSPAFTTTTSTMPGEINFNLGTSSLSVDNYNNLAVRVRHDLLDGIFGYITSLQSTQPVYSIDYDTTACASTDIPKAPLTGLPTNYQSMAGLILGTMISSLTVLLTIIKGRRVTQKS